MTDPHQNPSRRAPRITLIRLLPLLLLAAALAAVLALDLDRYLSFQALKQHRGALQDFVAAQGAIAALAYVLVYTGAIALSVPGAAMLTVVGGFLFGTLPGAGYAVIGATAGAVGVFLIARSTLGAPLRARAGPAMQRMEAGFQANAFNYLLVLRLIPLFPFFLVNIAAALLDVPLRIYFLATAIGILPGSLVYAAVGAGLGSVLEREEEFSPAAALTPEILAALAGLALLALLPVAYRAVLRRRR